VDIRSRATDRKKSEHRTGIILFLILLVFCIPWPLAAARFYLLEDYYNLLSGPYTRGPLPFVPERSGQPSLYDPVLIDEPLFLSPLANGELDDESIVDLNLEGQLDLSFRYGKDFALGKSSTTGAGTAGLSDGFEYDFLSRILLTGSVADRLFIEFDYDSERKEDELGGDRNTYDVTYRGREDEFLKEVNVGNKNLAIQDSRYLKIDQGNADSFALRGIAGWKNLHMEGLFRFNDSLQGRKEFTGSRNNVEFSVLDVEQVRRQLFFLPDTGINEATLRLYRTATGSSDVAVDGKNFVLLSRGRDFSFDNTRGRIYLLDSLLSSQELIVVYEKGGVGVGDPTLGLNAIIDPSGNRDNFNQTDYSQYFDVTGTYLYLQKKKFNSYWELRNAYFLEEYEGETLFNVKVDLRYTANQGLNSSYDSLLPRNEIDTNLGVIFFNFEDSVGFYPRPFPGVDPFSPPYTPPDPDSPFDFTNPIYGGVGDPLIEDSINTLVISYDYNTDIYFLDFNLVPGSVQVWLNSVLLEPQYYTVDNEFGILDFDEGLIKASDTIEVTYRYTGFGTGEQSLFSAGGFYYENGPVYVQNLTAYETGLKGQEAPEVGDEATAALTNDTMLKLDLGADDDDEGGAYLLFDGEFAFSHTNNNVYGSAIVADMEREDFTLDLSMNDQDWILATRSSLLQDLPLSLGTRGDVYFKNYWEDKALGGEELKTLSWNIPSSKVFSFGQKAGPYNTADQPVGGADTSLVIDYLIEAGSSDGYATVTIPLNGANYSSYERFNLILQNRDIAGDSIRLYVELLQKYDEDLNGNSFLDGEKTINDAGFFITPEDGNQTNIGTDREGKSNGRIDSEDLNENRYLDTGSETGVILEGDTTPHILEFSAGASAQWHYPSLDLFDLIASNPDVFQSADALRLTIRTVTPTLTQDATGKVVINRIWFSGSSIVNQSPDYLTISEVSVDEDPTVRANAFSRSAYGGVYESLHGDASYRNRNDLVEKTLKVFFDPSVVPLSDGREVAVTRRFEIPTDLSFYGGFSLFLYLPQTETVPANLNFTLAFVSSQNERLEGRIPGSQIVQGWNRVDVRLAPPYTIELNDQEVGSMTKTGDLRILKRLAEIGFGLKAEGGSVSQPLEIWLDEWFVNDSEGSFDTAFITEGTFGYWGDLLNVYDFPLLGDPSLLLGFERQEGAFYSSSDERSDRYYAGLDLQLFKVLGTDLYLSREDITTVRNEEELPNDLSTDDYETWQSHTLSLDFENAYLPVLGHSYQRVVTNTKDIELRSTDYEHNDETTYSESLTLSEKLDLPFGLSQSYLFSRDWVYNDTLKTIPSQSPDPTEEQDAGVNQLHRLDISYGWLSNFVSAYYNRDRQYSGLFVPDSESWGSAYGKRLSTLFKPPGQTIEDGLLASAADVYGLNVSIPLVNILGYSFIFDSDFSEKNFDLDGLTRDAVYNHRFEMSFPFYFLGIDSIEITPLWQREFRGDYKGAFSSLKKKDMYLSSYSYLFRPPLYYMVDRGNDYKAVDIYRDSPEISGTTTNLLRDAYILDLAFAYDRWFIPSYITLGVNGETRREGDSYRQSRGLSVAMQHNIQLRRVEDYFKKNVVVTLDYAGERQYDTKLQNNSVSLSTEYNAMRTEYQGLKIYNSIAYDRKRQHIGDKGYYLFPGVPDSDVIVAEVPPSDRIENEVRVSFLWEVFPKKQFLSSLLRESEYPSSFRSEETFLLENIYTFTERRQSESFSNIPVRITLEHKTEYVMENLSFTAYAMLMFGSEEQVNPDYVEGNFLRSLGFEFGTLLEIFF
jgi:hypothetical protein